MNEGLARYSTNSNVFMIVGYNFPFEEIKGKKEAYFLPMVGTQAWGTWKRAWDHFDPKASGYEELKSNEVLRKSFNLSDSYDYTSLLFHQMESSNVSSWAIRWWWSVFKQKGLSLFPDKSLIKNIGWDGTGRHSGKVNPYSDKQWKENYSIKEFPTD